MARGAVLPGLDVRGRFAGRLNAIMARRAGTSNLTVIKRHDLPLLGAVAGIAGGLRANMGCGFAFSQNGIVAIGAPLGRSGKRRVGMAGFARKRSVPACQRKSG